MIRLVLVDWGTSSFRLWAVAADGSVPAERKGGQGMSRLTPPEFGPVLEAHLAELAVPASVPVLICGMAGARTGWREVAYLDLPLPLELIADAALRVNVDGRDIRILPGVAQRLDDAPDVMRGEETMLLGAVLDYHAEGILCMPGTHSKWARVEGAVLTRFDTYMTGEMFDLLSGHSTLAGFPRDAEFDEGAFEAGLRSALSQPEAVMRRLFGLRAGPLLSLVAPEAVASRLSGLLIGLEIAGARAATGARVTLIASGILADRYHRGLSLAGLVPNLLDADLAVRAGLIRSAAAIWERPRLTETTQ